MRVGVIDELSIIITIELEFAPEPHAHVYVPGVSPILEIVAPGYVAVPLITVFDVYPEGTITKRPLTPPGKIPNVEPEDVGVGTTRLLPKVVE